MESFMHEVDFVPLLIITSLAFLIPILTIQREQLTVPVVVAVVTSTVSPILFYRTQKAKISPVYKKMNRNE